MKMSLAAALIVLTAVSLSASSYYSGRLDDPKAVYLTRENFPPVRGDGIADDTEALQQAINKVQETTNQGILFIPSGRYRLSKTVYIWPGIRLIGFGTSRPVFVLAANTPGFQQDPAYMIFFAGFRPGSIPASSGTSGRRFLPAGAKPPDANPGTFYSAISNIDVEIQGGNPGAV